MERQTTVRSGYSSHISDPMQGRAASAAATADWLHNLKGPVMRSNALLSRRNIYPSWQINVGGNELANML